LAPDGRDGLIRYGERNGSGEKKEARIETRERTEKICKRPPETPGKSELGRPDDYFRRPLENHLFQMGEGKLAVIAEKRANRFRGSRKESGGGTDPTMGALHDMEGRDSTGMGQKASKNYERVM